MTRAAMHHGVHDSFRSAPVFLIAAVVIFPPSPVFAQDADEAVLRIAKSQLESEVSLWGGADGGTPSTPAVTAERVAGYPEPLRVWRVVPSLPHAHPYLLAGKAGVVLRLGGFPAPDLSGLAAVVGQRLADDSAAATRAKMLATLADEFGALRYVFAGGEPGEEGFRHVLVRWKRCKPRDWPSNAVFRTGHSTWRVTLTMLSQNTRSFNRQWMATAYSFEMDESGSLISWSKREASPFNDE